MADYQDPLVVDPANGVVRGDTKPMPNRGSGSGFVGNDGYGADTGPGASNSMGSIHGSCGSDPAEQCYPPGDGRFTASGHGTSNPGSGLGGATKSDPWDDTSPGDPAGS